MSKPLRRGRVPRRRRVESSREAGLERFVQAELWHALIILTAYPAYVLVMAGVLAICGASRKEIAKWALRQADRQRFLDLLRAARGVPSQKDTGAPP